MPSTHQPKQNRVNPLGEIIAVNDRGTLMGNRGCLHNEGGAILRQFEIDRWIYCVLHTRNRRGEFSKQTIMRPNSYTQLFFLDEATALSAGHRPCCDCMRPRFNEFREYWMEGNPGSTERSKITAAEINKILHQERLNLEYQKRMYQNKLSVLPVGTFVLLEESDKQPYLVAQECLIPWSFGGYGKWREKPGQQKVWVLTPPSIVRSLAAGFRPNIHPSLLQCV